MQTEFLPDTPEGKLWRFVEELGEVLQHVTDHVRHAAALEMLHDVHHHACSCGRFGWRADRTGVGLKMNNAQELLKRLVNLRFALDLVRLAANDMLRDELDDLVHAAGELEPVLLELAA